MGPNGSGKTTLLRILATELACSFGSLEIFGVPPGANKLAVRGRMGFARDQPIHMESLTGRENAELFAELYGLKNKDAKSRLDSLFLSFGLSDVENIDLIAPLPYEAFLWLMEKSKLIIGKKNRIREHVTINPGTKGGGLITKIGNNCLFMVGSHVAHDCTLGNNVIMANNATLAGHVKVDDFAIIGGISAVHQFVRIGKHAMVGGMSGVENDVIPYGSVMGNRAYLSGLNIIGLKRRGFNRKQIHDLRTAFRLIFSIEGTAFERLKDAIKIYKKNRVVMDIVRFIKNKSSSRAICQPKQKNNV